MSEKISRRTFIKLSAIGLAAGTAGITGLDIAKLAANSKPGSYYIFDGDVVVKLTDEKNAALANVGGSVLINDETILIRTSQTQFSSVNLVCTHKGCTVEVSMGKLVCPCHGSEFDFTGAVLEGPAKKNLKTYTTVYDADAHTVTINIGGKKEENKTDSTKSDTTKVK